MGDIEKGICSVCKKICAGNRKYYHYNIDCECCGGNTHFEIVFHCNDCIPIEPKEIRPILSTKKFKDGNKKSE